ncbi:tRNA (adenosine(37)-N6)-dimethylallyltransferase MiaA [Methylovirgula sp. HY1]|uniref:tRNA (adenosine(37)-N6)-dimethylallyltransferase MiaA n=1 Tax=Methylovirgula sp. HY1 TaxID=2822761 RepID=UPI001C5AEA7D|nr:tRNA (adenosine(37)-N6)-dimethylallyltransferase MiaA [Methylovirgula sp. HY1]QXX75624.1 tRNA dimethylallyltransferase [Methylovirgula sp. HY1]
MTQVSAILIAGPTASGKSALAARLAARLGGAVVNADSMQVYRDLAILTARPKAEELALAPHLLFGHIDGAVNYSVGRYLEDAEATLADLRARNLLPIFVGGTGLYFKALTQGLSDIPKVPEAVRAEVRARAAGRTAAALHAELAESDPAMAARLRPSDSQRIIRALEVFAATGQSLATFQGLKQRPLLDPILCRAIFLAPTRADLRSGIDARFESMLAEGALAEVENLRRRQLDPALPVMRAHGVPHLLRYLAGECDLAEAAQLGKSDTRRYAKRQFIFARHQLPTFQWVEPALAEAAALTGNQKVS